MRTGTNINTAAAQRQGTLEISLVVKKAMLYMPTATVDNPEGR